VLRKFWLLFAQACTLCLAALFVVATLRPDVLPRLPGKGNQVVLLREGATPIAALASSSYADAARKADAVEVAKTLGLPTSSVTKGKASGNADVSVVLGQDYKITSTKTG